MSLTPRNVGQLAATHCDVRHRPESGEVLEKTSDADDQRRELSIQRSRVQVPSSPPFQSLTCDRALDQKSWCRRVFSHQGLRPLANALFVLSPKMSPELSPKAASRGFLPRG